MINSKKQLNTELVMAVIIAVLLLSYLIVFSIINFKGFEKFCTSDMYEDTLVARLMWEQKTLFPKNYLFGNQLYVLATPVIAAIFYGVFGSLNTGMALATTFMSLLIFLSMNWMLKPYVKKPLIRLAAVLTFVISVFGPDTIVREDGQLFFVMCSFYACYIVTEFVVIGDYIRSFDKDTECVSSFIISLILCFCMGMQSLRQTCITVLPVLLFEFLRVIKVRLTFVDKATLNNRRSLLHASLYLIANISGFLTAKLLHVTKNTIYEGQSVLKGASIPEKFSAVHDALSTVSGFEFIRGENGLFFAVVFVFLTGMVIAAAVLNFLSIRKGSKPTGCLWWLCAIACFAVILSSFVTSVKLRPIYIFTYYILPSLSLIIVFEKLKPKLQKVILAALIIISCSNIYYSYFPQIKKSLDDTFISSAQEISDYAATNGYTYIYGSHSHTAPCIAVYSDGELTAGCWEDECIFKVSKYINIKDIYHLDDYSKALFVFLETELDAARTETEANGTSLTFLGKYGRYYVYSSSKQLMYPISDNIYNSDIFPDYN